MKQKVSVQEIVSFFEKTSNVKSTVSKTGGKVKTDDKANQNLSQFTAPATTTTPTRRVKRKRNPKVNPPTFNFKKISEHFSRSDLTPKSDQLPPPTPPQDELKTTLKPEGT